MGVKKNNTGILRDSQVTSVVSYTEVSIHVNDPHKTKKIKCVAAEELEES